jgi:3-isopropylmalate/(R)-2-methylmalate dehydratase small subunit
MKGKVWKFGDNVNTDLIIPARYLNTSDHKELAEHVMEDADADFAKKVRRGDIIVGGENFGCGSSREHAPIAIKTAGVACVVAKSFARIFFRNAINIGLPIVECPAAVDGTDDGDTLDVEISAGVITNARTGKTFKFPPFPKELQGIVAEGGLINYVKKTAAK